VWVVTWCGASSAGVCNAVVDMMIAPSGIAE
jgi:hypothetical protein